MIAALRDDGTEVQCGDRVLAVWDNGEKSFGKIVSITGSRRFTYTRAVTLQTYTVRCNDTPDRPAHAWHIKKVFPKRKAANA